MRRSSASLAALALLGAVVVATAAQAQEPGPPDNLPEKPRTSTTATTTTTAAAAAETATITIAAAPTETATAARPEPPPDPGINTAWYAGPDRWFVSALVDLGVVYLRPRFAFGWGRPHADWIGIETNPIVSTDTLGVSGGLRIADDALGLELRVGGRYMVALGRTYLVRQPDYQRQDIELRVGETASYGAFEAELSGAWDIGGGVDVFGEAAVTYVVGVNEGFNVFEEVIKAVIEPPWVVRVRGGWTFAIGFGGALKLGPVLEFVEIPAREALILRAGIVARLKLYDDLEVRATIAPALGSPDDLGTRGGDAFLVGVRYRWASGWSPKQAVPTPPTAE